MSNGRGEPLLSLDSKTEISKIVLKEVLTRYVRPAVVWNADRDSTATLHLVRETVKEMGLRMPPVILADHGDHFPETLGMAGALSSEWEFRLLTVKNQDLLENTTDGKVSISSLNDENRQTLEACKDEERVDLPHSGSCFRELAVNIPIRNAIARYRFDVVILAPGSGIQNDSDLQSFINSRDEWSFAIAIPAITFVRSDFWKYTFDNNIPLHPKYREGYTTVFCMTGNSERTEGAAWEGEMDSEKSAAGNQEERERMMEKLRALGYI